MSAQPAKSGFSLALKIVVVLLVLIAAAVYAFFYFRATANVAVAYRDKAADLVTGTVVIHADKDLQEIKSEVPGRVIWIDPRQIGDLFKAGEPIVKLDASELERKKKESADAYKNTQEMNRIRKKVDPRLELAAEKLANAKKEFDRGAMSESDWKDANRAYKRTENDLEVEDFNDKLAKQGLEKEQEEFDRQIKKMTICAPVDCVLKDFGLAPGAVIGANSVVATYYSRQRVVVAKVGEEDISKVKVGQAARVRVQNLGQEFDAKVTTILPFADSDTQRYTVYLDVKTDVKNLVPNATGEATITVGEHENSLLVPRRALFADDRTYVVHDGVVERRKLKIGFRALNLVEVVDGIKEGEQVIVDDLDQFRAGQHVQVKVLPR